MQPKIFLIFVLFLVLSSVYANNETNITATTSNTAYVQYLNVNSVAVFAEYTVLDVPTASSYQGGFIMVSNETGGYTPAFSDGTNWRRTSDRAVIS